jgi:Asp-tRNA(Asn)/Glu-tRNA(Gln) amidotransferase A subunit family amidase
MPYDLTSVKVPRLAGAGLKLFASLMEGAAGKLLLPKLLRDAGIEAFRQREPEAAPTLLPVVPPDEIVATYSVTGSELARALALSGTGRGFQHAGVKDFHEAYRNKTTTPVEVAERAITAILQSNSSTPALRSIIKTNEADLRRQALASAQRWAQGKPIGPLDGVPIAVKDELDVAGYTTDAGTNFLGREAAVRDATPVERLRAQGALIFSKANMHEIGIGVTGNNPHHGIARNPYNLDHYAGGSSGGSGAAVAAGLGPIAVGADGGGSVRIPAAFCGVYGLKATYSRVSEAGAFPLCWSVAHVGPLAWNAADLALAYYVMAGPDELDPVSQRQPAVSLAKLSSAGDLSDVSLGVYEPWFRHASRDIVEANEAMLREFEKRGARIKRIEIENLEAVRVAHAITIASEMAASMEPHYRRHRRDFSADTRINLALARTFSSRDFVRAQRVRTVAMADFARALYEVDAILTPATGVTAPFIRKDAVSAGESDLSTLTEIMRFVVASNFTGNPAVSFPVGYDAKGLPIGMQAIGRHWEEDLLLRLALASESAVERRAPQTRFDLLAP